jgi:hypothetical protein
MTHKIRMNTELRNKLFNKIKHVHLRMKAHKRERTIYKQERMLMSQYKSAFGLASQIVERAYPKEDVMQL